MEVDFLVLTLSCLLIIDAWYTTATVRESANPSGLGSVPTCSCGKAGSHGLWTLDQCRLCCLERYESSFFSRLVIRISKAARGLLGPLPVFLGAGIVNRSNRYENNEFGLCVERLLELPDLDHVGGNTIASMQEHDQRCAQKNELRIYQYC